MNNKKFKLNNMLKLYTWMHQATMIRLNEQIEKRLRYKYEKQDISKS